MPSSSVDCALGRLVTEALQVLLTVSPVVLDLDPELEMHRALQLFLELQPRRFADTFQDAPAFANDDAFLLVPLDPDNRVDRRAIGFSLEAFYLHGQPVGNLLMQ